MFVLLQKFSPQSNNMNRLILKKAYYSIKFMLYSFVVKNKRKIKRKIFFLTQKEYYTSKVFCIGFNKTGTTTLGKSFELLGYRNSSYNKEVWLNYYQNNEIIKILKYAAKFESFDDLPWLKEDMIPILDKVFPNSKFVYLTRDRESWKKSFLKWGYKKWGEYPDADKKWEEYKRHEEFVLNYFKNRSKEDFIILDVKDEKGFLKLAEFLGKKTKREKFPVYNKS